MTKQLKVGDRVTFPSGDVEKEGISFYGEVIRLLPGGEIAEVAHFNKFTLGVEFYTMQSNILTVLN